MDKTFFIKNRHNIAEALQGGLVVLSAHLPVQRTNDMAQPFEQESNFWYLTGINASRWMVIYDGTRKHTWLVRPDLEDYERVFDETLSDDAAIQRSGADEVIAKDELEALLRQLRRKHASVFTLGKNEHSAFVYNPSQKQTWDMLDRIFERVIDCRDVLARKRAIKQPEEITMIQAAINCTAKAFAEVRQRLTECQYEYQVEAVFSYAIRRAGGTHAYDPIVAFGKNACTLHYSSNADKLKAHQVLLCDVGAKYGGYAADISRNFAIGTPTARQSAIHTELKVAQAKIVDCIQPGLRVQDYQTKADTIMLQALKTLKLEKDSDETTLRAYMPHAVSHGLGIDVHDSLGKPSQFEAGMVVTVEPGIYIPEEGIGMRIEDDILVTASGRKNMSKMISTDL